MIYIYILICLFLLPLIIKLVILYIGYIQWALLVPIPFSVRLWNKRNPPTVLKKPPIGFFVELPQKEGEMLPSPVSKQKK